MFNLSKKAFIFALMLVFQANVFSMNYLNVYFSTQQQSKDKDRAVLFGNGNSRLTFGGSNGNDGFTPPRTGSNQQNKKFNKLNDAWKASKKLVQKGIDQLRGKKHHKNKPAVSDTKVDEKAVPNDDTVPDGTTINNSNTSSTDSSNNTKIFGDSDKSHAADNNRETNNQEKTTAPDSFMPIFKTVASTALSAVFSAVANDFTNNILSAGGNLPCYKPSDYSDRYSHLMPNIQVGRSSDFTHSSYQDGNTGLKQSTNGQKAQSSSSSSSSTQQHLGKGKRSFSDRDDDASSDDDTTESSTSKKSPAENISATTTAKSSSSTSSSSSSSTIAPESVGMEGVHFTTQETISLELNRIKSEVETLKQNFGDVYQANVAHAVTGSLDKVAKFYQQNGNLEKARLFTVLSSKLCDLAKKSVPYVKAVGTAVSNNSTNFKQQFDNFGDHPVDTTLNAAQAVVDISKILYNITVDSQQTAKYANLIAAKVKEYASLPGPQKLEKLTELTMLMISPSALVGGGKIYAGVNELSVLSEASKTICDALKNECINARDLAIKSGVAPSSLAGVTQIVRDIPETVAVVLGCEKALAERVLDIISKDSELIKKEGSVAKAFEKVVNAEKDKLSSGTTKSVKIENFAEGCLQNHFQKHVIDRAEWGANSSITIELYLDKAKNLLNSPIDGHTIDGFTSKNGFIFRYNKATNEIATAKPDGTIETIFRPKDGILYWEGQIKKYK